MILMVVLAATANLSIPETLNAWAGCVGKTAEAFARKSSEGSDVVAMAAMGFCGREEAEFFTAVSSANQSPEAATRIVVAQRQRLHDMAAAQSMTIRTAGK